MKKILTLSLVAMLFALPVFAGEYSMPIKGGNGGRKTPAPTPEPAPIVESVGGGGGFAILELKPRATSEIIITGNTITFLGNVNGNAYLVYEDGTIVYEDGNAVYHTIVGKSGTAKIYLKPVKTCLGQCPVMATGLIGEVVL